MSVPAILVACAIGSAGLGGCYDLSTSGPRPEDFARDPGASNPQGQDPSEKRAADPMAQDDSRALVEALDVEPAAVSPDADLAAQQPHATR